MKISTMKKGTEVTRALLNIDPEQISTTTKSMEYYKKVSDIMIRTRKALGQTREFKESTQPTINLKFTPNAIKSTTDFQIKPGLA